MWTSVCTLALGFHKVKGEWPAELQSSGFFFLLPGSFSLEAEVDIWGQEVEGKHAPYGPAPGNKWPSYSLGQGLEKQSLRQGFTCMCLLRHALWRNLHGKE